MFDYENPGYLEHLNAKDALWYDDMLRLVLARDPGRVLELGCGDGAFTRLLAANGARVDAADKSRTFLAYARRRHAVPGVRFLSLDLDRGGLAKLAREKRAYDTVVLIDVLEHLADKTGVLDGIGPLLPRGGRFVFQCPNLYCNAVSQNYVHRPDYILLKLARAVAGWWAYRVRGTAADRREIRAGLDYKIADHDAVTLTSPYWFLLAFRARSWRVRSFTTFAWDSRYRFLKRFFRLVGTLPFVRYLGGRMLFEVEVPAAAPRPARRR